MSPSKEVFEDRALSYARGVKIGIIGQLGFGLDGVVFKTTRHSAVKVFERSPGYRMERDIYRRFQDHRVARIQQHAVPRLLGTDDQRELIEISIVQPPYLLDFAKATLDEPADFPDYVMDEWRESRAELFEDRWPHVLGVMGELERRFGVFLMDINPGNITFASAD